MSDSIAIKLKLTKDFFSEETSTCLFKIMEYACKKHIGVTIPVLNRHEYVGASDEAILFVHHSLVILNAEPLIGSDMDFEVQELRPYPLLNRLKLLAKLFEFIFKQNNILSMKVLFTSGDISFEGKVLHVEIEDIPAYLEESINKAQWPSFYYQFYWKK